MGRGGEISMNDGRWGKMRKVKEKEQKSVNAIRNTKKIKEPKNAKQTKSDFLPPSSPPPKKVTDNPEPERLSARASQREKAITITTTIKCKVRDAPPFPQSLQLGPDTQLSPQR